MGVRRRGLDIGINAKRQVADAAARAEAQAVIERWNQQLVASRDMLWSPTIRAALIAGTPWLDVFCPGCGTSRAIDLRKVDRHLLASVATLVLGCGARGARNRPRCRGSSDCMPCRLRQRQRPRTCEAAGWRFPLHGRMCQPLRLSPHWQAAGKAAAHCAKPPLRPPYAG
jgi:hypothetical protein